MGTAGGAGRRARSGPYDPVAADLPARRCDAASVPLRPHLCSTDRSCSFPPRLRGAEYPMGGGRRSFCFCCLMTSLPGSKCVWLPGWGFLRTVSGSALGGGDGVGGWRV